MGRNGSEWEVINDNGGGFHILIYDDNGEVIAAHTSLELCHSEAVTNTEVLDAACEDARRANTWLEEFEYQGKAAQAFAEEWDDDWWHKGGWCLVAAGEVLSDDAQERKYELTDETIEHCGHTLHRIRALRDFGDVKAGDLGGWVESEANLSHEGDCWVFDDAKVYENARVFADAAILNGAEVFGSARVSSSVRVSGHTTVCDNQMVCEFSIFA